MDWKRQLPSGSCLLADRNDGSGQRGTRVVAMMLTSPACHSIFGHIPCCRINVTSAPATVFCSSSRACDFIQPAQRAPVWGAMSVAVNRTMKRVY